MAIGRAMSVILIPMAERVYCSLLSNTFAKMRPLERASLVVL